MFFPLPFLLRHAHANFLGPFAHVSISGSLQHKFGQFICSWLGGGVGSVVVIALILRGGECFILPPTISIIYFIIIYFIYVPNVANIDDRKSQASCLSGSAWGLRASYLARRTAAASNRL